MTATDEKFVDLDARLAEKRAARVPLEVKMFGRKWNLPGSPPAAVTMLISRWFIDGLIDPETGAPIEGGLNAELTQEHYAMLLGELVPQDIFAEWCAKGLETDDLEDVFVAIMERYDIYLAEGSEGKDGNRAARRSPKSSNTGRSSRPTSTRRTGSRTSTKS